MLGLFTLRLPVRTYFVILERENQEDFECFLLAAEIWSWSASRGEVEISAPTNGLNTISNLYEGG
jgi:hypothetical protein